MIEKIFCLYSSWMATVFGGYLLVVNPVVKSENMSQISSVINAVKTGFVKFHSGCKILFQSSDIQTMPVNEAIVVTVLLDYGGKPPSVAEALKDIERIYLPNDLQGRTFAILDATGKVTPDKKLQISMHISSERSGIGRLKFKRNGEIIWECKIVSEASDALLHPKDKKLTVLIENGDKKSYTIDGSGNPATLLDASLIESGVAVRSYWKDGTEKEIVFLYSTCRCPVKVKVKRMGNKMTRSKKLPVIFPDDPAVLIVINRLMGWNL